VSRVRFAAQRGKPHVLILCLHQVWNQDARQVSLAEAVAKKQRVLLRFVQRPLQLHAGKLLLRGKQRVLFVSIGGDRCGCLPRRPAKVRHNVVGRAALVEPSRESRERKRSALSAHVVARVLKRSSWSVERHLARREIRRQANRRQVRQRHRSARNAASPVDHFKSKAVSDLVSSSPRALLPPRLPCSA
jgi:hypothetical protein